MPSRRSSTAIERFGDGRADDGLIQRFQLLVYPDIATTWTNVDRWPNTEAKARVFEIFQGLATLDPASLAAQQPESEGLPFLRFTPEAQVVFDAWRADLEHRLRAETDEHPVVLSHLAKYRSLLPSLALLFHLVDGVGGPVSTEATERAAAWCAYLEAHARRVYHSVTNGPAAAVVALSRKIQAGRLPSPFRARAVVRQGWAGLTDPKDAYIALDTLCDLHWLRREEVPSGGQGGRPSAQYHVNPGVLSVLSVGSPGCMGRVLSNPSRATLTKDTTTTSSSELSGAIHTRGLTDETDKTPPAEEWLE